LSSRNAEGGNLRSQPGDEIIQAEVKSGEYRESECYSAVERNCREEDECGGAREGERKN
jgi:hypothetical protein